MVRDISSLGECWGLTSLMKPLEGAVDNQEYKCPCMFSRANLGNESAAAVCTQCTLCRYSMFRNTIMAF